MTLKQLFSRFNSWIRVGTTSNSNNNFARFRKAGYQSINETSPDDVFLVGYPKSGNTWLQNLVAGLMFGMETQWLTDQLTQVIVPNVHGFEFYKRLSSVTCFKSHFLPQKNYRKVIYLIRDGRDAMVSYYHMLNAESPTALTMNDVVMKGHGLFPCRWHEHVEAWSQNPFGAQMLIVRYEDLIQNCFEELNRVSKFIGLKRSDDTLRRSIEGNNFEQMQRKEKAFGWDNLEWDPKNAFVRKGQIGSFKSEMPVPLIKWFEQESAQQLLTFGYDIRSNEPTSNSTLNQS